jgi:hypothetical protein
VLQGLLFAIPCKWPRPISHTHFQWDRTFINKHKTDFTGLLRDPFYTVSLSGKNYTVYPLYNCWKCLNDRLWRRGKRWRLWSAGLSTGRRPSSLLREELGNGHILNVVSIEGGMRHTSMALYFYGASKKTLHKPRVTFGNMLFQIKYSLNYYLQLFCQQLLSITYQNFKKFIFGIKIVLFLKSLLYQFPIVKIVHLQNRTLTY